MSQDRRSSILVARKQLDHSVITTGIQTQPFQDYQQWQGGCIRILNTFTLNVPVSIPHTLRRKPLAMEVLYAHGIYTPKWQDTATAWNNAAINVNFDTTCAAPNYIVVLIR